MVGKWNYSTNFCQRSTMQTTDLRFAFDSGANAFYYTSNGGLGFDAPGDSANYAISAVAVPAPLPILGILPVVGFLKRMRKRQRA